MRLLVDVVDMPMYQRHVKQDWAQERSYQNRLIRERCKAGELTKADVRRIERERELLDKQESRYSV